MDYASHNCQVMESSYLQQNKGNKILQNGWIKFKKYFLPLESIKAELIVTVHRHFNKYIVEKMTQQNKIKILFLSPYHAELTPVDLIWVQLKAYFSRNNLN